jgi:hypothetical protein
VRLFLLLSLLSTNNAYAEGWVVFPIFAEQPPPMDPTLLRLSVELAKVISDQVGGDVRLAKREEREEHCPLECPAEIASMMTVDHVIAMHLKESQDQLAVILFEPSRAPEIRKIACTYQNGVVRCDAKQLAEVIKSWKHEAPLDEKAVHTAFGLLAGEMAACGPQEKGIDASVRFRIRPDGRATDVRIDPVEVQDRKPYDCIARVVESLRVPPFPGKKAISFRLSVPKTK